MKEIFGYGWYRALALLGLIIVFVIIAQHRGSMNEAKFADTFTAIDTKAETYNSKAFTINVQDPNYGGDYTLERCPAMQSKKDDIRFEDDVNGYFSLSTDRQDTLKFALTSDGTNVMKAVPPCTVGDGGKAFENNELTQKCLTQKQIGLPAIVPKADEIKLHLLLGMFSVKESTMEKELLSKQTVMGIDKNELLEAIFSNEVETDEKGAGKGTRKGLVGLQLMSPEIIKSALGDRQSYLKDYVVYVICEIKSEAEIKEKIKALKGYNGDKDDKQLDEFIAGIRHLKENDTVIIPQKAKALIKDKEGAGKFTATGRMKRN